MTVFNEPVSVIGHHLQVNAGDLPVDAVQAHSVKSAVHGSGQVGVKGDGVDFGDAVPIGIMGLGGHGYGGVFGGTLAPMMLQPSSSVGPPTSGSHLRGEFFVDAVGALFFNTEDGAPGKWKRVSLVDL